MATLTLEQASVHPKAFYAILDQEHGILTKLNGTLTFMATATGVLTEIEPAMCAFLMPLGEVGLAEAQQCLDRMRGTAVGICTSRVMGVH